MPLFIIFFTYVKQFVGSKITKETLTVVQEFGIQLSSYNLKGKLVAEKFVDISRVRDFVINEVGQSNLYCLTLLFLLF